MAANAKHQNQPTVQLKLKEKRGSPDFTSQKSFFAKGTFTICNDKGLHTRPSTELVKCAASFRADVQLIYEDFVVNAKSLLGILTLAASRGSKIAIEAEGEDAKEAVETIIELAQNKFYIHY